MNRVYGVDRTRPACRLVHGQGAYYLTGRWGLFERLGLSEETVFEYEVGEVVGPVTGVSHVVPMGRSGLLDASRVLWADLYGNVVEVSE